MVRAATLRDLDDVREKVTRCFEAGALATGATLRMELAQPPYAEMRHDPDIAAAYGRNALALGRRLPEPGGLAQRAAASTDMGNLSLAMPAIHPGIGIDSLPAVNHQPSSPPTASPRRRTRRSWTVPSRWRGPPSTWLPTLGSATASPAPRRAERRTGGGSLVPGPFAVRL